MTGPKVGDYFPEGHEPFLTISGALARSTGKDEFFACSTHYRLEELVEDTFRRKPISFRFVFGRLGEGKTWTLSWLWRQFEASKPGVPRCLVLGIRRLQHGTSLERTLVEQLLAAVAATDEQLIPMAVAARKASSGLKTLAAYWADDEGRDVLTGRGRSSRAPRIENERPLNMARQSDLTMLLVALFEAVKVRGFDRMLILIDELEGPVDRASPAKITLLADFLRDLQDSLQEPPVPCPHIQFLLSGTSNVAEQFDPQLIERTRDLSGVVGAFVRRAEPPFRLDPPTPQDLEEMTNHRIKVHREKKMPGQPPKPFKKDAIMAAWKHTSQKLGDFSNVLEKMYEIAVAQDSSEVDLSHFEAAKKAGY